MSSWTVIVGRPGGRLTGAAWGVIADMIIGEPPLRPHPVSVFGDAMGAIEERLYRDGRLPGLVHAGAGVGIGVVVGTLARSTAAATYLAVAGRSLAQAAAEVHGPLERGDLIAARAMLRGLVGRDTAGLDDHEICRAVVESVAENTVDAIIAPALWGALAGAPGALAYRAVNTLDARVGHHNERYERFGWASARLDDAANLIPARVTAGLVVIVRPHRAVAVLSAVRYQADAHPSPNAGVAEAAFAAALGVRLGGENHYGDRVEVRPTLGAGPPAGPGDIARAVCLSRQVSLVAAAMLATAGWILGRRGHRP
ncbi:MAG: adenosylcobinamide-phosphate synthase CbiB [Actinomycetota bacterium]|nr:adenosylcobinamide-phosphate synthase CbiB [Actinomycetota bacterium]